MASSLPPYKAAFIEFMVACDVLTFGDFVTKSGRRTPYFVNAGRYRSGSQMARLAGFYAAAIREEFGDGFDVLFGPAYKGIPLAVATAMVLASEHGHDVGFCFDRKEVKDHGEGGALVGRVPGNGDRVLLIEDVTTAGTSIRETVPKLRAAAPEMDLVGLVISVDRLERGTGDRSALAELRDEFGFRTTAIVTIDEVREYLHGREVGGRVRVDDDLHARMLAYREEFGAKID